MNEKGRKRGGQEESGVLGRRGGGREGSSKAEIEKREKREKRRLSKPIKLGWDKKTEKRGREEGRRTMGAKDKQTV